ncbi:hypothetical protein CALCODRAFT_481206 [Calocera cornea HHB12733]|uniref:Uncharacterized protein n=1 Tax=Calocera cornea HHB12733 TaxID=1353952 RepID=A0A165HYF0_9BASI|nr:hypothetical protein CALCODRAFT_481206 [Calocera cornea HHB12733]
MEEPEAEAHSNGTALGTTRTYRQLAGDEDGDLDATAVHTILRTTLPAAATQTMAELDAATLPLLAPGSGDVQGGSVSTTLAPSSELIVITEQPRLTPILEVPVAPNLVNKRRPLFEPRRTRSLPVFLRDQVPLQATAQLVDFPLLPPPVAVPLINSPVPMIQSLSTVPIIEPPAAISTNNTCTEQPQRANEDLLLTDEDVEGNTVLAHSYPPPPYRRGSPHPIIQPLRRQELFLYDIDNPMFWRPVAEAFLKGEEFDSWLLAALRLAFDERRVGMIDDDEEPDVHLMPTIGVFGPPLADTVPESERRHEEEDARREERDGEEGNALCTKLYWDLRFWRASNLGWRSGRLAQDVNAHMRWDWTRGRVLLRAYNNIKAFHRFVKRHKWIFRGIVFSAIILVYVYHATIGEWFHDLLKAAIGKDG